MFIPDPEEELKNCMMECASDFTCLGHKERGNDALIHRMRAQGPLRRKEFTEKEWKKHVDDLETSKKKGIGKTRRKIRARMKLLMKVKRDIENQTGEGRR